MTERVVAFLRGINVGGRRIDGAGMVEVACHAGFSDAASYQASGNVVLGSDQPGPEIEDHLADAFMAVRGWDVEVFVRAIDELRAVVADLPFAASETAGLGKPQVGFARTTVDLSALSVRRDLLAAPGTQLYWVPHAGVSDADLDMADFDKIGQPVTIRTLGTVERLITKFGG
jgi:uncharacterized protein (DUF1697 family)